MNPALVEQFTFEAFRSAIQDVATTEGRIVASVTVVLVLVVLGRFVLPFAIRTLGQMTKQRIFTEQMRAIVDGFNDYLPTSMGYILLVLVQLVILFGAAISLLIIWGLVDLAISVTRVVGISIPLLVRIGITIALFVIAYIGADALEDAVQQYSDGADRITMHQQEIILRMGHVGVLVLAVMAALGLWGLDLSGLLIGAGFLGIVVGLAARQTLGSMIAGFVLMFSRPFSIGDWVEIGGEEGIVTKITIMQTRLQNFDGEIIVIPNDVVANQPITNRTRQGVLRNRVTVGVDYETDIEHAESVAMEVMEDAEPVTDSPPPRVIPTDFGDSAVLLELRFWIDTPNPPSKWAATSAVIHATKTRFEEEGIKIPYPQRELSGRKETGGFRIADATDDLSESIDPYTDE